MIMPRASSQLLLPVNNFFIALTLVLALVFDMIPLGRQPWMPDLLAVVLVVWNVHQPRRIGVGWALVFGLLIDVHHGAVLGQHALSYSVLAFGGVALHRRLLWFALREQALHVLPLFALAHLAELVVRLAVGGMWPGWSLILAPFIEASLWPLMTAVLLAPQRRPPDPDAHRPL